MMEKYISVYKLKQLIGGMLESELRDCGFHVFLRFASDRKNRVCTLKFPSPGKVEVCFDLGSVSQSIDAVECSRQLKIRYCAVFVAEYIKQIERAGKCLPQSYFEGLSFLNAVEVCCSEKAVGVYSPLFRWKRRPGRSQRIRPLEISSAEKALNRILSSEWSVPERQAVEALRRDFRLYASLPEISYVHVNAPVYALADSLKKLADLVPKDPELARRFPVLTLLPFDRIRELTVNDLFMHCIRSDDEFPIGVAVRCIAFLHLQPDIAADDSAYERISHAMQRYIDRSLAYCAAPAKDGKCFMTENLFAVKIAAQSINNSLSGNADLAGTGTIHTIF